MNSPETTAPQTSYQPPSSFGGLAAFLLFLIWVMQLFQMFRPIQWEYRLENIRDSEFTLTMTNLGNDGWELVSARRASESLTEASFGYEIIYKRRR